MISSSSNSGGSGEREKGGKTQRAHPTLNPTQHQTAPVCTIVPQDPDNQTCSSSKQVKNKKYTRVCIPTTPPTPPHTNYTQPPTSRLDASVIEAVSALAELVELSIALWLEKGNREIMRDDVASTASVVNSKGPLPLPPPGSSPPPGSGSSSRFFNLFT